MTDTFQGKVIHGRNLGAGLGFPTVNIDYEFNGSESPGVYVSRVLWENGTGIGITNVGTRPTVNDRDSSIETHILDFDGDLYGQQITVKLLVRLRDIEKFSRLEDLKEQLEKDRQAARELMRENQGE